MNFSLLIALLLIAMNAAATVSVCDVTPDENVHFNSPFRNCAITDPEDVLPLPSWSRKAAISWVM